MAMTIQTNTASLNAQRSTAANSASLSTTMARLSSGLRINSAKDDAAGLAIADRMNTQVRGMNVAIRNAGDGISMAQVAEGGLSGINDMLQRMRELAVQARNGSNSTDDRANLNKEYQSLSKEVARVVESTSFNQKKLLDNAATEDVTFQVGAGTDTQDGIKIEFKAEVAGKIDANLTTVKTTEITDDAKAETAIDELDKLIDDVTGARSYLGAQQSKFDNVVANLSVASENVSAARGRIVDADFAVESANLSRAQVLSQAGNTMLAQANQQPQQVLSLLR